MQFDNKNIPKKKFWRGSTLLGPCLAKAGRSQSGDRWDGWEKHRGMHGDVRIGANSRKGANSGWFDFTPCLS